MATHTPSTFDASAARRATLRRNGIQELDGTSKRRSRWIVGGRACALAAVWTLAACASDEGSGALPSTTNAASSSTAAASTSKAAEGSTAPGIKVPLPPAPDQVVPRVVAFDPCFRVVDSLISQTGFDPNSRQRYASEVTSSLWTKIGCSFRRSELVNGEESLTGFLSILTNSEKVAEIRQNPRNEVVSTDPIDGRPAVIYRPPLGIPTCDAAIESPDGTLLLSLTTPRTASVDAPEPCDQVHDVANIVAGSLDSN
ncbi:DUF3558 domain-containing protein [Nocardia sp. NPDC058480]|uniref:DUF3558 domain-containing protein n=1 Tax=unclassified Nocardia TaxID=2637762 RepID=UPI003656EF86